MVVDANTGAVLHNRAGDEKVYPASLTKMMTLYMTFELIELGRLDYDSKIKMTQEGADAAPSKLELEPGEELTVLSAIKALITKSANDVAIALAMHIGGTETNFARLMTNKARDLGMPNTTFRNASGLPDPEQTTTARDMITLGLRLQDDFPRHYRLFSTRSFTYGGKNFRNHNTLLARYSGTDGIKTGYTRASGFNLVTSVRRDGKHLVAAVFGGDTARERNTKMQSLLNAAFPKASTKVTRKPALVARAPQPARAARSPYKSPRQRPRRSRYRRPPLCRRRRVNAIPRSPSPESPGAHRQRAAGRARRTHPRSPRAHRSPCSPLPARAERCRRRVHPLLPARPFRALSPKRVRCNHRRCRRRRRSWKPAHEPPAPRPLAALAPEKPRAASARAGGPFEIQIGAFGDSAEAERRMAAARERAGGMLDAYRGVAIPVQSGASKLYRARFRGFDATAANDTCSRLRSLKIDCFVIKPE